AGCEWRRRPVPARAPARAADPPGRHARAGGVHGGAGPKAPPQAVTFRERRFDVSTLIRTETLRDAGHALSVQRITDVIGFHALRSVGSALLGARTTDCIFLTWERLSTSC